MNHIPIESFPMTVRPVPHEQGRYMVQSKSRAGVTHLIDVMELRCNCERDHTKGNRIRKKLGHLSYTDMCWHLRDALVWHGMMFATWQAEQESKK